MPVSDPPFATAELFRYVRARPLRVLDLGRRAARSSEATAVLERSESERQAWAREYLAGKRAVKSVGDLRYGYLKHLRGKTIPRDRLPTSADLKEPSGFDGEATRADPAYQDDRERLLLTALALRLVAGTEEASTELRSVGRLLDFVDVFPGLKRVQTREPYATPVLERAKLRSPKTPAPPEAKPEAASAPEDAGADEIAESLQTLWRARNRSRSASRAAYEQELREVARSRPSLPPPEGPSPQSKAGAQASAVKAPATKAAGKKAAAARTAAVQAVRARAEAHARALRERTEALQALKAARDDAQRAHTLEGMLTASPETVATYVPGRSEEEVAAMMKRVWEFIRKHGLPVERFCQAYETAAARADATVRPEPMTREADACGGTSPDLTFADTVRILGEADLIRVDETFVRYSAGEISYVETVLAGEVRKRRVKATRYVETVTETFAEETSDASQTTRASTKQELRSQVETQLQTRLQSDVSASANASGGGTLGVVELQGGGAVDASVGVGLDAGLDTSNESQFSQEIVSEAIERTRTVVRERQLDRAYSLDETLDHHEIDNARDGATSLNGVYCFLDRHVAITETIYGRRLFLLANVHVPGRSLLCARLHRLRSAQEEVGEMPRFDITPADITPANYLKLAGRFKAQNVEPPPAPVVTLGRTFKTDTTNTSSEGEAFDGRKIAELAVPFFSTYKRFLIAETVALPEGYEVMEVTVSVNHGANGLSIPADLPLRGGAALVGAGPALASFGGYGPFLLPVWMWYVGFLASPLLHYNCDSSNVTVAIGTESQDSGYYFFDPETLVPELFELLGTLGGAMPGVLAQVEAGLEPLLTELAENAVAVPGEAAAAVNAAASAFVDALRAILEDLVALRPTDALQKLATLGFQITGQQIEAFRETMGTLFEPFRGFIQNAIDAVHGEIGDAIVSFIGYIVELGEGSQVLSFSGAQGTRGELPVSFNTVAVKPGITINLSACLRRTDEALARWQLATFASFYRAHLQLVADYESRAFMASEETGRRTTPPARLRAQEHAAVKERVLHTLNNVPAANGSTFSLERMNLLEHAIDWDNLSYRVFGYGPTDAELRLETAGAFQGMDARRRAFTTALWAQVMIPVSASPHHVGQVMGYFEGGPIDFEGELQNEELVALYRDFVLGLEAEPGEARPPRFAVMPTEFVVLKTPDLEASLPVNPLFATAP